MGIKRFYYVACGALMALLWAVSAASASPPVVGSEPLITPTLTLAPPTPTSCPNSYNYTVSTGTIVSGTGLLPGSQCGACIVNVALPFPFSFYGQTYTSANLSTQGNLQFTTTHLGPNTCPLPEPPLGPAMMPHWDELLETAYHPPCQSAMGTPCGIYTSVSGSAPNRIFNIQWRARFMGTSQHTANFEIRLYENSPYFEYIYGWVSYTGGNASIGVQDGACRFTTYSCNTWYNIQTGTRLGWGGPPVTTTPTTQPTNTPTIGPPCGILTFGNPGTTYCTSPTSYFYSYSFYVESGCPSSMNGTATVDYEVAPDSSGPWTVYDTQTYPVTFQRGWNSSTGTFEEPGIPSQHQWYRISYAGRFPNNVTAYAVTNPARRCDIGTVTPTTMTPTPTCCNNVTGNISSACQGTSYRYTFGLTNSCSITTTASGALYFEVSPNSTGPWTSPIHGDYFNYQIPPGYREETGSMWSSALPPGNNWFRYRLSFTGNCWTVNVASTPQPACVAGTPGTVTPTATACPQNYAFATATATIVPGTLDTGNHCDDCFTQVTLPFPYQLYDQTFTSVHLESNGRASFPGPTAVFPVECLPQPGITYNIFPYWGDDLLTDCAGCGIYTSVSGSAPNRVFNIEWRARYFTGGGSANFEIRLHEGQTRFDVIYGAVSQGSTLAGVQKDNTYYTQYTCNGQGGDMNNGRLVVYTLPGCGTVTPGPTSTGPPAVTYTATSTPTSTATSCSNTFTDVPPTHTFYSVVQCLACRGIVSGYSDGTFRPNNPVTRGQLAKIVSGAAGFNEPVSTQTFEDVTPANTFYEWIERLTNRGYMTGYLCGSPGEPCTSGRSYFRPFANATRGQTAKIVANSAGFTEPPAGQTFEDVPFTHTFYEFIQRLATRNVMQGYNCGSPGEPCLTGRPYFRPGNDVTRGQSAKIVANTFFPACDTP